MQKKALVTGACGFIGSYILDVLLREGYKVRATDLENANRSYIEKLGIEFIPADLRNKESLKPLFDGGIDYVFHLAAAFDFCAPWDLLESVNVFGMENLCDVAVEAKVMRFVFWSTGGVYGPPIPEYLPVKEDHPKNPANNYEKSKWIQEQVGMKYYKEKGLPVIIIRPGGVVYGPGNVYGAADILKLLAKFKIGAVVANVKNRVGFVHAEDVARAALFLAEREDTVGEAFNVGDGTAYTQNEFITHIANFMGYKVIKVYIPIPVLKLFVKILYRISSGIAKKIYPRKLLVEPDTIPYFLNDYWFSSNKLFNLGFKPKYPDVKEGIKEFIQWYIEENIGKKK